MQEKQKAMPSKSAYAQSYNAFEAASSCSPEYACDQRGSAIPRMKVFDRPSLDTHREKIFPENNKPFNALVARKVGKKEILEEPKARAALEKEWSRLRSSDGGKGCWDKKEVREWSDVVKEANSKGKTVHVV